MAEINKGTNYYLEILVTDKNGDFVPSLTITYKVIRSSDNTVLATSTLTEIGSGVYQNSYLFSANGQYRIEYYVPSPYSNEIETVNVSDASSGAISDKLDRILGLCNENMKVIEPVYNKNGDLTDGIIKIYASASDLENDVNPIAVYDVGASYKTGKYRRLVQEYISKRIA